MDTSKPMWIQLSRNFYLLYDDSSMYRELVGGQCPCQSNAFELNSTCILCDSKEIGCTTCTYDNTSINALPYNSALFICVTCNNTLGYYVNTNNNLCMTICGDGIIVAAN